MKNFFSSLFLVCVATFSYGQIIIDQTQTPDQLVNNVLVGSGVIVTNVTYNYSVPDANVIQTTVGYFNNNGTSFPITEGIMLGTGDVILAVGPNNSGGATNNNGVANPDPNDPDLAAIGSATMNNECILEFDFIPAGDSIVFNYIFASEEYHEYAPSSFNDAFGFFISGPGFAGPYAGGAENIAIIPGTSMPVTINNLNNGNSNTGPCQNCAFLTDNTGGVDLQYDAHTVVLQAAASVVCGQTYHIKIAIADAGDQAFDSAVFLEASSFSSNGVNVSIASATGSAAITEACDSAIVTFTRPEDSDTVALTINYGIAGTATNGVDYNNLSGTVTFPVGVDTVQFYITPNADGIAEGIETVILSVDIVNACGDTITTTATIEITDPLPFNVITSDTTITCPTDSILISATTDGGIPQLDYTWLTGQTNDSIWVPALNTGTVTYTVDVTDVCGVTSQGTIDVTVAPAPQPTLVFNDQDVVLCPGQQFTFEVVQVNNPYDQNAITYNWYPQTSSTSQVTITAPNTVLWEYVEVYDGCYTVTDSVKVTPGGVNITQINVTDALNCPGQSSPTLGIIEVLPTGYTYTLTGGGITIGPQASNQFTNLTGGLTYFLNVVDANGCFTDTAVAVGTAVTAVTADWIQSTLDSVTCFGMQDGSAEIGNIQGGLNPGPYDITWTHLSGDFSSLNGVGVGTGDVVDTLYGGQWVVSVVEQGSGCAWSQTFTIFEPAPLVVDFSSVDNPDCFGGSDGDITIAFTGGNNVTIAEISDANNNLLNSGVNELTVNGLVTGWYYVYIEDDKGCTDYDTVFIDQPGEIDIDFTLINPSCYGIESGFIQIDTVYNYQDSSVDSLYYDWVPFPPSGINGTGAMLNNHLAEGFYQLKITDSVGCNRFFDFNIVYPEELKILYANVVQPAICRDQIPFDNPLGKVQAALTGGSDGNGNGTSYNTSYWFNETTQQQFTVGVTTITNLAPGYYTFFGYNDLGCTVDTTIYLDSLAPIADFTITSADFTSPYEGTAVVEIELDNTSQYYAFANDTVYNGNTQTNVDTVFIWTMGLNGQYDVITESLNTIYVPYTSEGVYTICLQVIENLNGCIDSTCKEIIVHDVPSLTPANVFTPDGDGINDEFYLPSDALVTLNCTITDRWGNVMFIFESPSDKWDGTNMKNGKPCTDGTYFYVYEAEATNGTKYKGQGTVQIFREH